VGKGSATYTGVQRKHRSVVELHFYNPNHADTVVDADGAVHLAFATWREVHY
jgi:hypothetical protein